MGHIYREKAEIPIPNTAHVNGSNGQVSVYELDGDGHRTGVRKVIGLATSDTTMHPNDNFCILFPQLWERASRWSLCGYPWFITRNRHLPTVGQNVRAC